MSENNERPLRLEILWRLTEELKKITVENGYNHDLSESVFRGRDVFGDNDPIPMVSVIETPEMPDPQPQPGNSELTQSSYFILVQGFTAKDYDNPTDKAHFLCADVRRRLYEVRRDGGPDGTQFLAPWDWQGRGKSPISRVSLGRPVVRPPDELSSYSTFWLTVSIEMVENLIEPYSY